jgi:excisionase family DNA binding protein
VSAQKLPMPDPWGVDLTTRQAAALLGVPPSTLRVLADEGVLPHRRTRGGHRRFLEADVLALRSHRERGEPPQAATRAAVWHEAARQVLRAAEADLGAETAFGRPFGAAAEELRRGLGK